LKPEWRGSPLVQEKYQAEKVCDKRHRYNNNNENNNNNNNIAAKFFCVQLIITIIISPTVRK